MLLALRRSQLLLLNRHMASHAVAAIDQGTSSTRVVCVDRAGRIVAQAQKQFDSIHPKPAWTEQDPMVLLATVTACLDECHAQLRAANFTLTAIGVTNQRETTVAWCRATGAPLHNAIVWLDTRTSDLVDAMAAQLGGVDALRGLCGLPLATYFSGVKMRWLRENVPSVEHALRTGQCMVGTVDSWLIWNLTGGVSGQGVHVTDVTNASRTMLMNLRTCQWDRELLAHFGVPIAALPTIRSSAEVYGKMHSGPFAGVPIAACLGDQQAALVGQRCFATGEAKNT
jgi:glycerol kinase